jgi:integrase
MATISAVILQANSKADGTWNVSIRIWHNGKPAYLDTAHYVGKNQVKAKSKGSKTLIIKDTFVLDRIAPELKKYRDWITDNAMMIEELNAKEIKEKLLIHDRQNLSNRLSNKRDDINFLEFCDQYLVKLENSAQASSARPLRTVYHSLKDYFNKDYISISEIRYVFLVEYEAYLRTDRVLTRPKKGGGTVEQAQYGLNDAGLHNHMRDLRGLFNKARSFYNDEDFGIIKIAHYPFKKYKVGSAPVTEHRNRSVFEIAKIRDAFVPSGSRTELARDLCMLSFYMLGMNAGDIYELPQFETIGKRYEYNRSKTRNKRKDNAFISIKVLKQAKPLLKKYAGNLQGRYSSKVGLNSAIDHGLKGLSKITGIPNIDFYDIRHSVGTWARRLSGYSKEDVAEALNQTERTVTDIYIAPDWSLIDRIQESIVALMPVYGPHLPMDFHFKT